MRDVASDFGSELGSDGVAVGVIWDKVGRAAAGYFLRLEVPCEVVGGVCATEIAV